MGGTRFGGHILTFCCPTCERFQEKGNLEVLLFTIQSKLRATNRKLYVPSEGKSISDINKVLVGRGRGVPPGGPSGRNPIATPLSPCRLGAAWRRQSMSGRCRCATS